MRALGKHMTEYGIHAKSLDGFKLTAFLTYFAAQNIDSRVIPASPNDFVLEACKAGISKMGSLYIAETKALCGKPSIIPQQDSEYLAQMVYKEVNRQGEIGVGPNGLGAIYLFKLRGFRHGLEEQTSTA